MMYTFELLDAGALSYDLQIGIFDDDRAAEGAAKSMLRAHRRAFAIDVYDVERKVARVPAQAMDAR